MRLMTLLLAALIVFVPNQLHFPTSLGFRGLNIFNLLLLAGLLLLPFQPRPVGLEEASRRPPLTTSLLLFYIVLGLSLLAGLAGGTPDTLADLTNYKTVVSYSLLYFVAWYGVHDLPTIRRLIALILFVFLIAAFEAIREGLAYGLGNFSDSRRAAGPFSHGAANANYAGVFYSIFASFALAVTLLGRNLKPLYRAAALGCYFIGCFAVFMTYSRQSFLILGVTTLLLTLRRNIVLSIIAAFGMLSYPLWAPEGVVERIEMTQEETTAGEVVLENSAASRYELWDGAWEIIREHPFGVGFNQFQHEVEPYLPSWVTARDAQNQYLLIAAESGVQGLLAYLILLIALFRIGVRVARLEHPTDAHALGSAFLIAMVAVLMGNIYSSTFFSGEVMGNFWILAGLMSRYALLAKQATPAEGQGAATPSPLENIRRVYARWQQGSARPRQRPETGR